MIFRQDVIVYSRGKTWVITTPCRTAFGAYEQVKPLLSGDVQVVKVRMHRPAWMRATRRRLARVLRS